MSPVSSHEEPQAEPPAHSAAQLPLLVAGSESGAFESAGGGAADALAATAITSGSAASDRLPVDGADASVGELAPPAMSGAFDEAAAGAASAAGGRGGALATL